MPINTLVLNKYLNALPAEVALNFKKEVEKIAPLIEELERNEMPPTQNHYAVYLNLCKDMAGIALCLAGGGNRLGILAAASINGVPGIDYQSALICNVAK